MVNPRRKLFIMAEKTTEHQTLKVELPSHWRAKASMICFRRNQPICREVLACGGWRGTGLTPLWQDELDARTQPARGKAVCALTPHPPQSKTLARLPKPFSVQRCTALPMNRVAQPSRLRVAAASRCQQEHRAGRSVNSQARTPALLRRAVHGAVAGHARKFRQTSP